MVVKSIKTRGYFYWECNQCHTQISLTEGTLFHSTNPPLTKWFWAICLVTSDKGGISALCLSKQITCPGLPPAECFERFALPLLWGTRIASIYRLHELIEIDDALIGKRGRGAEGKTCWFYCHWQSQGILMGTYRGVSSGYLQEYLNKFCYRFNRRMWEAELPIPASQCLFEPRPN